jgi:hypothetical protein
MLEGSAGNVYRPCRAFAGALLDQVQFSGMVETERVISMAFVVSWQGI